MKNKRIQHINRFLFLRCFILFAHVKQFLSPPQFEKRCSKRCIVHFLWEGGGTIGAVQYAYVLGRGKSKEFLNSSFLIVHKNMRLLELDYGPMGKGDPLLENTKLRLKMDLAGRWDIN